MGRECKEPLYLCQWSEIEIEEKFRCDEVERLNETLSGHTVHEF